jgi:hypothetical protein
MKKFALIMIIMVFIAASLAMNVTKSASAVFRPPTPTPVNDPEWNGGPEVVLDPEQYPVPDEWSVALSKGVEVTAPGQICYPFRKGTYGWTGTIYQWAGHSWQALDTTLAWVPDTEGQFMACAYAPSAGLYMFYGYFDPALAPEKKATPEPV